jgi:stage II sporulation protein D
LDVEDYVRGVLPAETSSKGPKEYLKVQAIISRTYGLRQSLGRAQRGYDVVDNTSDQIYKGAGVETPVANQAIDSTAGEVLAYGDDLAFTPFHSDSGGHTAANADVWGREIPYLPGAKEPLSYRSPNASWTVRLSSSQVETALSKMGRSVGGVKEIRVTAVDAGGRAKSLTFVGSSGSSSARSSLFRTTIGPNLLKSTMLRASATESGENNKNSASAGAGEPEWLPKTQRGNAGRSLSRDQQMSDDEASRLSHMASEGVFTSAELLDMLLNPSKRKDYLDVGARRGGEPVRKTPPPPPPPPPAPAPQDPPYRLVTILLEDGSFTFYGRGWGHGVGLSQWGARTLAEAGWTAERILAHYYPGTVVKRYK